MAEKSRIVGDHHFTGNISIAGNLTMKAGTIKDADISASAAITTTKMQHREAKCYSQEAATSATDGEWVIHVCNGTTGTLISVDVGAVVANIGAAVVDVDLKVNGASVLSGGTPIQIDSGDAALALVSGSITSAALAADDVVSIEIAGTAGGGTLAKGVFARVVIDETGT